MPIAPRIETFEPGEAAGLKVEYENTPPTLRCWFLNPNETELLQIQQDRLLYNWRKQEGSATYPSYASVRERFIREYSQFADFLKTEALGVINPNQCEITYVDHMISGDGWTAHGEFDSVTSHWTRPASGTSLPVPETVRLVESYILRAIDGHPIGRLQVDMNPVFRITDKLPMIAMNTTARGFPEPASLDGVLAFLDAGHDWANTAFLEITSRRMQKLWEQAD